MQTSAIRIGFAGLILLWGISITSATYGARIEAFIPNNSIVYLTLRDVDEIWEVVESSENWQAVFAISEAEGQMDDINQGMNMLKLMLGIDPQRIVEMLGYQIALTIFPGDAEPMVGIIFNTGGAVREVERLVAGLVQMADATDGNQVQQNTGEYRKVEYSIATLGDVSLTYGFVGDFFVVGINPGSFEGVIDTYRKERESILKNDQFTAIHKRFSRSQVFAYTDVGRALPLMTADMDAQEQSGWRAFGLDSLDTLVYSLDVLNVGGGHRLYAQIKPDQRRGILDLLLQEGQPLQSIQALSGEEDAFLSVAPSTSDAIWQFIEAIATAADDSGGFHAGLAQVETLLNLNIKTDVIGALTGEIAVWGQFAEGMGDRVGSPVDLLYEMDAAIVAELRSRARWTVFLDSIQNLANLPIQQYDYRGTTLHQVSLPPENPTTTIRYGDLKDLFLVSFSDERFESVVDNVSEGGSDLALKNQLKALPAHPVFLLQLKLDKLLPILITSGEQRGQLSTEALQKLREIPPLIASISAKQDEAWLNIEFISMEEPIESYGKLASVIAPAIAR